MIITLPSFGRLINLGIMCGIIQNFGNGKGSRGLVAVDPKGNFTRLFEKNAGYLRYNTFIDGPLLIDDALPLPSLITASQEFQTTDLDISYKVTDADDSNVTTGILAYVDGDKSFDNVIVAKTFIGDVSGKIEDVDVNVTHSLSWIYLRTGMNRLEI